MVWTMARNTTSDLAPLTLLERPWVYRSVATLLTLSGMLNVAWLTLGHGGTAARALIGASVVALAGMVWLVLARPPQDLRAFVAATLVGCGVLVTAQSALAGPTSSPFPLYYVWLAPLAFLVWKPRRAGVYVLALGASFALVLAGHANDTHHFVTRDLPALLVGFGGVATIGWTVRAVCHELICRHVAAGRAAEAHDGLTRFARLALADPEGGPNLARRAAGFIATTLGAEHVRLSTADGVDVAVGTALAGAPATDVSTAQSDVRIVRAAGRLDDGEVLVVHGVADVLGLANAREALERRRREEAGRDTLTGLPGRERFADRLGAGIAGGGTLMLVDIEDFGFVNETLGPEAGDAVLGCVAGRLAEILPPAATLARVGGDELAIFDPEVRSDAGAVQLARRLQAAVKAPIDLAGAAHHTSLSIGIVVCAPGAYDDQRAAMRDAHVAQRRAREHGRGRHELFDAAAGVALKERRRLEQELRDGLRRHEFRLVYQPVVDLATGRIVGAETLVRWQHPERGLIGPGEFIEAAEASDIILPLGGWILRDACRQLKAWKESSPDFEDFRLTVNLSGRQLASPGFVASVRRLLDSYEMDPRSLVFELTETALAAESDAVAHAVTELRELGIDLALDDFGTGYASISYVRRLSFSMLKLDRSFVARIAESEEDAALITAAISMGRALRMRVVAEGVESEEQAERLRELGCALAQGFEYFRPVAPAAIRTLMRQQAAVASGAARLVRPRRALARHGDADLRAAPGLAADVHRSADGVDALAG